MMTASPQWITTVIAILIALFCFGWAYNSVINSLGKRTEGYLSLLVAGGVLITLGGVALLDWQAAALCLAAFAASGVPMIVGDIWRTTQAREKRERMRRLIEAANGDTEETTS
jgi:biotin transporter BioY